MIATQQEEIHVPFRSLIRKYATHSQGISQPVLQEHQLALFFLDIRDFTPFIASRSAWEVVHLLQQLFGNFNQSIQAHGGRIIETAGDGFYAVFGMEEPIEQATASALKAGMHMLKGLSHSNKSFFEPFFHHHFEIGIGLHVGQVIVGQLGLGVNNNPTVMGYPVNVASRLQAATRKLNNNFLVSAAAFELLSAPPRVPTERIALKGVAEPMDVYLVGNPYEVLAEV
jgi:adenylate cyclase